MTYKLHDVVDVLAEEDSHAKLDGKILFLSAAQLCGRGISQVLQAAFIVVLVVLLPAIVVGISSAQVGKDLGIHIREGLKALLDLV